MSDLRARRPHRRHVSMWLDHDQAVIVSQETAGGQNDVGVRVRERSESEPAFQARIVEDLVDDEQVLVGGPDDVRTAFDRAYVAVTHRPDRLVDVEQPGRPKA
jgi:hypothetical protein